MKQHSQALKFVLAMTLVSTAAHARPIGENAAKDFVHKWFSLFDRNAPVEEFMPLLFNGPLEIRFPEATLKSRADFSTWYAGILRSIARASHRLERIDVTPRPEGAEVDLVVLWQARGTSGESFRFCARQRWVLESPEAEQVFLRTNLISEAPDGSCGR